MWSQNKKSFSYFIENADNFGWYQTSSFLSHCNNTVSSSSSSLSSSPSANITSGLAHSLSNKPPTAFTSHRLRRYRAHLNSRIRNPFNRGLSSILLQKPEFFLSLFFSPSHSFASFPEQSPDPTEDGGHLWIQGGDENGSGDTIEGSYGSDCWC